MLSFFERRSSQCPEIKERPSSSPLRLIKGFQWRGREETRRDLSSSFVAVCCCWCKAVEGRDHEWVSGPEGRRRSTTTTNTVGCKSDQLMWSNLGIFRKSCRFLSYQRLSPVRIEHTFAYKWNQFSSSAFSPVERSWGSKHVIVYRSTTTEQKRRKVSLFVPSCFFSFVLRRPPFLLPRPSSLQLSSVCLLQQQYIAAPIMRWCDELPKRGGGECFWQKVLHF